MPDREQSTRPPADALLRLAVGETLAAAHQLRAIGYRLEWLAQCLPLPPKETRDAVFESTSEEAFAPFPELSLYTDLSCIASDEVFAVAMSLEEAAERVAPEQTSV